MKNLLGSHSSFISLLVASFLKARHVSGRELEEEIWIGGRNLERHFHFYTAAEVVHRVQDWKESASPAINIKSPLVLRETGSWQELSEK